MISGLLRLAVVALVPHHGAPEGRLRSAALRRVLGLLLRREHLGALLDLLGPAGVRAPRTAEDHRRLVEGLGRSSATCLHRALAGYALLRPRGAPVRFVIGVARGGTELLAHAWLELDGVPLEEPVDPRRRYAVVLTHPAAPAREEPPMAAIRPNPDVLLTELSDGTGVLLHLDTKFYFALNRTGVAAWKLLSSGTIDGAEPLARALCERFAGAAIDAVRADVASLLSELSAESLILGEPAAP